MYGNYNYKRTYDHTHYFKRLIYLHQYWTRKYGKIYHHTDIFILQNLTPRYICITIRLPLYIIVPIMYHIKRAQIDSKNHETTSTSMFTPQFNQITHHINVFLLQDRTPRYIYVIIWLPLNILLPITYHTKHGKIYSTNSETTSMLMYTSQFDNITTEISPSLKLILTILLSQGVSIRCTIKISIFGFFRLQLGWW